MEIERKYLLKQLPSNLDSYESKKILLAHGDIEGDLGYKIYAKTIRNSTLLHLLSFLDTLL